ncbi:MAG: DNA polymerase IV [Verrucomicrobiae bacterium]|nr:DNA polymerase IV [Verrucomicrobiae bacterium]
MFNGIIHLDADAFFASVEQAADPRLRGRPVAVGGEKRGIIASASYEARRFGIYTPMPAALARRLCPQLILLPGDFAKYEQFSQWMFSYAYDFTPEVEVASIDEGYLDVTGARRPPLEVARRLREAIRQSLKISVSEGVATNKLVSQVASKLNKPAALLEVPPGREAGFLAPLPNRWLPGVGPKLGARLDAAGLARVGQIAATPPELLEVLVGSAAGTLHRFARGLDDRPVVPSRAPAKSLGQQETFAQDITDEEYAQAVLRRMADELFARLRATGQAARTLTVKVRYNDMAEDQCSESLPEPVCVETEVYGRLRSLLKRAWRRRVSLRLVSLRLTHLYDGHLTGALELLPGDGRPAARRRLAAAVDALREKFGRGVVQRGHDLLLAERSAPTEPAREHSPPRQAGCSKAVATPGTFRRPATVPVIPLRVRSYYSFLASTLAIRDIIRLAQQHETPALGLADLGHLHGAPEFVQQAQAAGLQPLVGAEITLEGRPLVLFVENQQGYARLCRWLSLPPGQWSRQQLEEGTDGLLAVGADARLAAWFPGRFYGLVCAPEDAARFPAHLPLAWGQPVHYATPQDRWKFEVVEAIRTLTLLRQEHPAKLAGELHWRTPAELRQSLRLPPRALAGNAEIAARCRGFRFPFGPPQFPAFQPPDGSSARAFLRRLVMEGARRRYPERWAQVRPQLEEELGIIGEVGYEDYFLVVWDLLRECRRRGIDWLTRGSAADSLVCYCLGISQVCPLRFELYFRRFLNRERMAMHKLPDIDVDFPHDCKDDVIALLFEKYGPEHCAVVGGFSTYQARGAVGDVGKALGLSEHQVRRFTEHFPWGRARGLVPLLRASPECRDLPLDEEPYRSALEMAEFLDGFPRYPKMHPCGVVLSRQPMHELAPTFRAHKGWPATQYDMDAVEALGLVKLDILAQGGLAVVRDALAEISRETAPPENAGRRPAAGETETLAPLDGGLPDLAPWDDPAVWELIAGGQARAVHHIESPAMVGLCRQSNIREIDGLVALVSVIRPGAANEQKKQKFCRRYQGLEPPDYPHPSLEPCLRGTFGLVVYEEHVLQICEAFAGLPPGRADQLRRALGREKLETIQEIGREFFAAARARGHPEAVIREVWDLVTGFAGYAFCKAHSTAYAVEAYLSAWLKRYHPAEFMAAVLSHGKGFYDLLVYVLECHRLGLPLLPPSVNEPGPGFMVVNRPHSVPEPLPSEKAAPSRPAFPARAIRVPVTQIKGLTQATGERLLAARRQGPFASVRDFYARVGPAPEEMELLIRAGALDEFGLSRTRLFWEAQWLRRAFGPAEAGRGQGWLLPPPGAERLGDAPLQEPTRRQRLEGEAELLGFPVSGHPLELFEHVAWETYCPVARLGEFVGQSVVTCGLVIEQRLFHQSTGEPMKFLTLADWTGMVETELFAPTYRSYGLATVRHPVLEVTATVEPFENGRGFTLRIHRAGKPREKRNGC